MATAAARARGESATTPISLVPVYLIGFLGIALMWWGGAWDVAWHRALGRETFWSPPHAFLYAGVTASGIAALLAVATALAGRRVRGRAMRAGPLHAELGIAVAGIGAALVIASGPLDELWHARFGRDVDIWSPPHLFAVASGALIHAGWALGLAPGIAPFSTRTTQVLRVVMLGALIGALVFGMNFYYIASAARDALFYPLVVAATIPAVLGFAVSLLRTRWAATAVAAAATILGLVTNAALALQGWPAPALPPLAIAGAVAVDLVRRTQRRPAALTAGAAFALAFVTAEWMRAILLPGTRLPSAATVDLGRLFLQYYAQVLAHPWTSAWPLAGALLSVPVAAAAWAVGSRAGVALERRSTDEPRGPA